ncbi:MAG TPA: lipoyl(octanoyl) transferase LipB [Candidatus Sulfotelmatobacter sp.]|nr:lipoyl(octanoyl) transferase LipB [Candidatus Sulfotelmatobacter sp.]
MILKKLVARQLKVESNMATCLIVDLGFIGYADAFELQKRIVAARKADAIGDVLLLCEHPHVITLGRSGRRENLLASERVLAQKGVEFHATNRGGDITYHGPGQIVGYPVIQLSAIRRDVVWYVRMLEELMIRTCGDFGITAQREAGKTGVWVNATATKCDSPHRSQSSRSTATSNDAGIAEKIGAIGVHISRWVTSHGFAFNVATDLRYFELIVPCGIAERKATSLEKILGRAVKRNEAAPKLVKHFGEVFDRQPQPATREELFAALEHFEGQAVAVPA